MHPPVTAMVFVQLTSLNDGRKFVVEAHSIKAIEPIAKGAQADPYPVCSTIHTTVGMLEIEESVDTVLSRIAEAFNVGK